MICGKKSSFSPHIILLFVHLRRIFERMNKKQKEKIGDLLLDLVKYIVTAILFATWFSDISWWRWQAYIVVLASLAIITWIGVSFFEDDKSNKKKK